MDQRIEDLDFQTEVWIDRRTNTRVRNSLQRAGIHTVDQLTDMTRREVEAVPGIGIVCLVVIEKKLKKMGLKLRRNT